MQGRMCLLGVALILLPIYMVKSPENTNYGGVNRHLPAKYTKYSNFNITKTRGSAMTEGLLDALVSRNSAITEHPI